MVQFVIHAAVLMWRSGCRGTSRVQSQFLSHAALFIVLLCLPPLPHLPLTPALCSLTMSFLISRRSFSSCAPYECTCYRSSPRTASSILAKGGRGCCGQADGQRTNGCVERHCAWGRRSLGTCASGLCASIFVVYFIKPVGVTTLF